jgi:hypothetical protein
MPRKDYKFQISGSVNHMVPEMFVGNSEILLGFCGLIIDSLLGF